MAARSDPYGQMRFLLEIDGLVKAGFSRCHLPTASSPVIEYREGNEAPTPRKLPGLNEYGPLVLEAGVTDESVELFEWRALVEQGAIGAARRTAAVVLLDTTGVAAARWEFRSAWPAEYEAPELDAGASEVAIERLVVVNEGFERVALERDEESEADDETEEIKKPPNGGLSRPKRPPNLDQPWRAGRPVSKSERSSSEDA